MHFTPDPSPQNQNKNQWENGQKSQPPAFLHNTWGLRNGGGDVFLLVVENAGPVLHVVLCGHWRCVECGVLLAEGYEH